jgi:ABC-type Fe3+ transport system permease subunit
MAGTLDFYTAAAQLAPLIVVTYFVESRIRISNTRPSSMSNSKWKERQERTRKVRNVWDTITLFAGIAAVAAPLLALYSGKPTGAHAFWTVAPLCVITMVMLGSILARSDLQDD